MKAVVAAFNQEKALVGAFSVTIQPVVEPMDRFAALLITLHLADRDIAHRYGASWCYTLSTPGDIRHPSINIWNYGFLKFRKIQRFLVPAVKNTLETFSEIRAKKRSDGGKLFP